MSSRFNRRQDQGRNHNSHWKRRTLHLPVKTAFWLYLRLRAYIAGFKCRAIQIDKNKSKPFNRLSPESGKWKEVNIPSFSPRFKSAEEYSVYEISEECFTQIYRDLHGDAMLVPTWMGTNKADGNQQKHLLPSSGTEAWIYSSRNS